MVNIIDIQIMTISDYAEVWNLWINTKGMGLNTIDDSREGIERFLKRNPKTSFVARDNGKIVGVILAGHDGRRGYIYHTAVKENMRKQGIATNLISIVMDSLKKEGINKVALVVFEKNKLGNSFWEKQGFSSRSDLIYRNKSIIELERVDT